MGISSFAYLSAIAKFLSDFLYLLVFFIVYE